MTALSTSACVMFLPLTMAARLSLAEREQGEALANTGQRNQYPHELVRIVDCFNAFALLAVDSG